MSLPAVLGRLRVRLELRETRGDPLVRQRPEPDWINPPAPHLPLPRWLPVRLIDGLPELVQGRLRVGAVKHFVEPLEGECIAFGESES